jgi:hypothetical protein
MTKQQQQLLVLGGLAIVMTGVYARAWRLGRMPAPPAAPAPVEAAAPAHEAGPMLGDRPVSPQRPAQQARLAALHWARDPFLRGSGGLLDALNLSGILWDAAQPMAIINGEMVGVGETIEGYRVVGITQATVAVSDGTETLTLQIAP